MKETKWMKGLAWRTVAEILAIEPDEVTYEHFMPFYTKFVIRKGNEVAIGVSLCSPVDGMKRYACFAQGNGFFDARKGKNKAAGRAVKAMINKKSDLPIVEREPENWSRVQKKRLREITQGFTHKSNYGVLDEAV